MGGHASSHRDWASPHRDFSAGLWEEKVSVFFWVDHLFLAGKATWIFDFGQKKPSDFGEDIFFLFFWRSPALGWKNRLNFWFRPEKALGFRRRTFLFFFGDHLIFTEKSHQSKSVTMKIWVKFVYGTNSQKILATCLFFTKVQSTLKKRPPKQNFTI